eukprot:m51a1_g8326 putative C-tail anchored protein (89) ;mRNA; f:156727-156993
MQGTTPVTFTVSSCRSTSAGVACLSGSCPPSPAPNTFGSVARIFTTQQEIEDRVILVGYVVGAVLNSAIAASILNYGSASTKADNMAP